MKINLSTIVRGLDDKPFKLGEDEVELLLDDKGEVRYHQTGEPIGKIKPDGTPIVRKKAPDLTVRDVCLSALNAQLQSDKTAGTPDLKKQTEKFLLAVKLTNGGEQELASEEVSLLKARVQEMYAPSYVVVIRVVSVLDPNDKDCKLPPAKVTKK